jgi:hypothetical protein
MSTKKKLQPHEIWDALERASLEDEAERIAALSDAELDQELVRGGLDPEAVRARGAEIGRSLAATQEEAIEPVAWVSAPPPPMPIQAFDRRWVLLLAAALALAGLGGGAVALGIFKRSEPPRKDLPDAMPSAPSASVAPPPAPSPQDYQEMPPHGDDKTKRPKP